MGLLIRLMADLLSDDDAPDPGANDPQNPLPPGKKRRLGEHLRAVFHKSPEEVLKAYDLSPEAYAAMVSMDRSEIMCAIELELEDWQFPAGEFPAIDKTCPPEGEQALYPDPQPMVTRINLVDRQSPAARVKVTGQGFVRGATWFSLRHDSTGQRYPATPARPAVKGTFRCGWFEHHFASLPSGTYSPVVEVGATADVTSRVPSRRLKLTVP